MLQENNFDPKTDETIEESYECGNNGSCTNCTRSTESMADLHKSMDNFDVDPND